VVRRRDSRNSARAGRAPRLALLLPISLAPRVAARALAEIERDAPGLRAREGKGSGMPRQASASVGWYFSRTEIRRSRLTGFARYSAAPSE